METHRAAYCRGGGERKHILAPFERLFRPDPQTRRPWPAARGAGGRRRADRAHTQLWTPQTLHCKVNYRGPGLVGVLYIISKAPRHGFSGSRFPLPPLSRLSCRLPRRLAPHCSMWINICEHLQRDATR
jgi:hypothetical protein